MEAEDQFIYEEQIRVCEHVLREVEKQSAENIVAESSLRLYERILNSVMTLHVLSEHARHEWAVDGVVILRTIHDAMLQLLWLLHDPGQRGQRAEMYPDYFHVDKLRMLAAIGDSGKWIGTSCRSARFRSSVFGICSPFGFQSPT